MEKATDNKNKKDIKIFLNPKWCKNCGICVAFCPKGVFESDVFGKPIVKYPEKCIMCMLCVVRCPDFAIDVVDRNKEKKGKDTKSTK